MVNGCDLAFPFNWKLLDKQEETLQSNKNTTEQCGVLIFFDFV